MPTNNRSTKGFPTWVDIRRAALRKNAATIRSCIAPRTKLIAVVKSNAYGHGMPGTALVLASQVDAFGVAHTDEALSLRQHVRSRPIIVLSYAVRSSLRDAVKQGIEHVVHDLPSFRDLERAARATRTTSRVHVKVDTGTSRIGERPETFGELMSALSRSRYVQVAGIFTHFADAENPRGTFTAHQQKLFESIATQWRIPRHDVLHHSACSAAILHAAPDTQLDAVRPGIALYGLWPSPSIKRTASRKGIQLLPALSWHTRVLQVKTIPAGTTVGYGRGYRARRKMKLAVLPVGYYDGYDRRLSNTAHVLIQGQRAPVLGNVCMNLTMVDVTRIPGVRSGTTATLLGKNGKREVTADQHADWTETINYEVVTRIQGTLPRNYVS